MENGSEGTPKAGRHQRQSSEGMGHFLCRGDDRLQQKLLGSNLTQQKQDGANIFRKPSGRLLEHGCQQVCQREDLWLVA